MNFKKTTAAITAAAILAVSAPAAGVLTDVISVTASASADVPEYDGNGLWIVSGVLKGVQNTVTEVTIPNTVTDCRQCILQLHKPYKHNYTRRCDHDWRSCILSLYKPYKHNLTEQFKYAW